MAKACPICRSRRWRKDRVSGSVVCEEGHILQDFRTENNEMDDGPRSMMFRRHLKKDGRRRRKRRTAGEQNPDYYRGEAKEYLRLQLFQLMLRVQVQALIDVWHAPPVLETIAKDVWTCVLSAYPLPSPPGAQAISQLNADNDQNAAGPDSDDADDHKSEGGEHEDNKDSDIDSEIREKLSETSLSSDEQEAATSAKVNGHKRKNGEYYVQAETVLVVLIISLWILRIPVMYSDIIRLIEEGRLPYLDFGSTSYIPLDAGKHMSGDLRQGGTWALVAPSAAHLHERVKRTASDLAREYGLTIPEMNAPPVLWRLTKELGGDASLYHSANEVVHLAELQLLLLPAVANREPLASSSEEGDEGAEADAFALPEPKKRRKRQYIPRGAAGMPELLLGSAVIVACKLTQGKMGLHDPEDTNIVSASQRAKQVNLNLGLRRSALSEVPLDFAGWSDQDLDCYVSKAGHALLAGRDEPSDNDWLLRLFPTSAVRYPAENLGASRSAEASSPPMAVEPVENAIPLHQSYLSFSSKDVGGTLPAGLDQLVRTLSTTIGVLPEDVLGAVEDLELSLAKIGQSMRGRKRDSSRNLERLSSVNSMSP